jgi:hypothetical protein
MERLRQPCVAPAYPLTPPVRVEGLCDGHKRWWDWVGLNRNHAVNVDASRQGYTVRCCWRCLVWPYIVASRWQALHRVSFGHSASSYLGTTCTTSCSRLELSSAQFLVCQPRCGRQQGRCIVALWLTQTIVSHINCWPAITQRLAFP